MHQLLQCALVVFHLFLSILLFLFPFRSEQVA